MYVHICLLRNCTSFLFRVVTNVYPYSTLKFFLISSAIPENSIEIEVHIQVMVNMLGYSIECYETRNANMILQKGSKCIPIL